MGILNHEVFLHEKFKKNLQQENLQIYSICAHVQLVHV